MENVAYGKESWINNGRQVKRHVRRRRWLHGHASRAVDGDASPDSGLNTCIVLDNFYVERPVWMVDLGSTTKISGMMILTWRGSGDSKTVQPFLQSILSALSGVTRVGDTRGGNWGCHPSIFSWKPGDLFCAHRCHYHYRFLLLSLGCHPLQGGVSPFLPVRPRCFSTILCKFAHNFFPSGARGGPPLPPRPFSDATVRIEYAASAYNNTENKNNSMEKTV